MKTIDEIQTEFVTAFNEIDDWMMQYEFLLQVGAELEPYPDEWRDDTHLIQGCQSKVWIHCEEQDGRLHIWGDSEALIIKGIIIICVVVFDSWYNSFMDEASRNKKLYIIHMDGIF